MPLHIHQAIKYIEENYDQDMGVEDISAYAGVSKSHLHRTFRQYANCTILEMINGLRLSKALFLLETTDLFMMDIAVSVGYSSRSYFTDLFTRTFEISPAKYRKNRGSVDISQGHSKI